MTLLSRCLFPSLLLLAACGPVQDTRPGQPVAHRQTAFKDILKTFEPMGLMLRDDKFNPQTFQTLASQLLEKRDGPWSYFGKDTDYPPSRAKSELWQEDGKFEAAKQDFFKATDKLAIAAKSGEREKAEAAYKAVEESCKSCHRAYKSR